MTRERRSLGVGKVSATRAQPCPAARGHQPMEICGCHRPLLFQFSSALALFRDRIFREREAPPFRGAAQYALPRARGYKSRRASSHHIPSRPQLVTLRALARKRRIDTGSSLRTDHRKQSAMASRTVALVAFGLMLCAAPGELLVRRARWQCGPQPRSFPGAAPSRRAPREV